MTERVAERVRRLLHENPELEIRFTEAITRDSYYQGPVVLFLHPTHQALVDELRSAGTDPDWLLAVVTNALTDPTLLEFERESVTAAADPTVYRVNLSQ